MKRDAVEPSAAAESAARVAPSPPAQRQQLYERMRPAGLTPLWEVLHALVPRQPAVRTRPAHWRWQEVKPFLDEAGRVITAEEAVRRVLILENPGWRGESRVTSSLYAGLQLILPGEVAPSHRHTQSALRFVVDGNGAYTAVDGERTLMHPGDFIITPHWTWHDHGNDGAEPVVWLDGLDIPTIAFFEAGFAENDSSRSQQVKRAQGTSLARFGANMLPLAPESPFGATSPIFNYPYERSREALEHLARHSPLDPVHGAALRYANPVNGGPVMPTIATHLQLLPAGFETGAWRTTAGTVYSVVEGRAKVRISPAAASEPASNAGKSDSNATAPAASVSERAPNGAVTYEVAAKDHFVVPPWASLQISAGETCVLFGFSDAPLQAAAGILRSEIHGGRSERT